MRPWHLDTDRAELRGELGVRLRWIVLGAVAVLLLVWLNW